MSYPLFHIMCFYVHKIAVKLHYLLNSKTNNSNVDMLCGYESDINNIRCMDDHHIKLVEGNNR